MVGTASTSFLSTKLITERDAIIKFLEAYKECTNLWDVNHKLYHNRAARERSYDSLVETYKMVDSEADRETVRKKIEYLRSSYKREMRKLTEARKNGDKLYIPSLWYFKYLAFLHPTNKYVQNFVKRLDGGLVDDPNDGIQCEDDVEENSDNDETNNVHASNDGEENYSEYNNVSEDCDSKCHYDQNVDKIQVAVKSSSSQTKNMELYKALTQKRPKKRYSAPESEIEIEIETEEDSVKRSRNEVFFIKQEVVDPIKNDVESCPSVLNIDYDNEATSYGKTVGLQLKLINQPQRTIAEKLISEVIFYARLNQLTVNSSISVNKN